MKKFTLTFFISFFFVYNLACQQVENPGFEYWEDDGTVIDEPVEWSSIKTSDGGDLVNSAAPVVWGQSNDAHSGSYSVELTNVLTLGTIVATGIVTNGRVHAEFDPNASYVFTDPDEDKWNTTLTGRPDSVAIWAKYQPSGSDTAQVKVLLHTGDGTLPPSPENQANWVAFAQINISAAVNEWTRFVVPFFYFSQSDPEFLLTILTSGAGTVPVEGSKAWFDDMELIYNPNGIDEKINNEVLVRTSSSTVILDNLPQSWLTNCTVEILDLNGSLVYKSPLSSNQFNVELRGFYVMRILGQDIEFTRKIYLQ